MSEVSAKRTLSDDHRKIADIEQQLLALGTLPRLDGEPWDADQWARYTDLVRELSTRLSAPVTD